MTEGRCVDGSIIICEQHEGKRATMITSGFSHQECTSCAADLALLQRLTPPVLSPTWDPVSVVDLFCGFGGMTIGLREAAAEVGRRLHVPLAVDHDEASVDSFLRNFPASRIRRGRVEDLFDGQLGRALTRRERRLRDLVGPVSILVGGPPCQGHSDLNNHTRRSDPRNGLYARMARAAEVLEPEVVIVENVPQVTNDRGKVVDLTRETLVRAGYQVHVEAVDLRRVGVPQTRRRHLLLAARFDDSPEVLLANAYAQACGHIRSVSWAISDLENLDASRAFDRPSVPSAENRRRIEKLFARDAYDLDNDDRPPCHRKRRHTYRSMYGRLWWDRPAQTITTGFGSMGQGRYVHPTRKRTITPHEAARLQTIPDYVQLGIDEQRGTWARLIGNAVPPFLTLALGRVIIPRLRAVAVRTRPVDQVEQT